MTGQPPALSTLLDRSAQEIRRCRAVVVQLEDAVHTLLDAGGPQVPSGPLADLQAIDLLDQRLEDLAVWIAALAEAVPGCRASRPEAELARGLRLADMRLSLTGMSPETAGPALPEVF